MAVLHLSDVLSGFGGERMGLHVEAVGDCTYLMSVFCVPRVEL